MRPITLGRKNWIHIGSPQAGPKVTAILSVIETCRRLKISARGYLVAVLPGLADTPVQCLSALTPTAWAAQASVISRIHVHQPVLALTHTNTTTKLWRETHTRTGTSNGGTSLISA